MPDVEFGGETFRVAESVAAMAMMRLVRAVKDGGSDENLGVIVAALDDVFEQLLAPADWERFQQVAMRSRASLDDMIQFMRDARAAVERETAEAAQKAPAAAAGMWSEPEKTGAA